MTDNAEDYSDVPEAVDNSLNPDTVDYELEEKEQYDSGDEGSQNPPMAVYQPWDFAFEETDFHIQNPEDTGEIDVYSGHAGTAHVWEEYEGDSDAVVVVYEFDSTLSFGNYPNIDEDIAEVNQDLQLAARQALSKGDSGITVQTSLEDVEGLVRELGELDEALLEEGHAEYNTSLLAALDEDRKGKDALPDNPVGSEFDEHSGLYRKKDRIEG